MDDTKHFGKIDINLVSSMDEIQSILSDPDTPFRILISGDFTGRSSRDVIDKIHKRRCILIDRDNFDEVMETLDIDLHLSMGDEKDPAIELRFKTLDDFHPDSIFRRVELFDTLKRTRDKLLNASTFAEAKAEMQNLMKTSDTMPAPDLPNQNSGNLLDQILGGAPSVSTATSKSKLGDPSLDRFLTSLVAPYLAPHEDPQQGVLVSSIDEAISGLMRKIIHHPDFQALEAAWRSLYFLVDKLETGPELKLYLVDISKEEVIKDLLDGEELNLTETYNLLVEKTIGTPGAEVWSLWIGNYTFEKNQADIETLGRIAKISSLAQAPFISAANPQIIDPASTTNSDLWNLLRRLPESVYLGLVLPRFLLRLPYGRDTEPIEEFDFEEMQGSPIHDDYLWGNSSTICAYLIANAFIEDGWALRPGSIQEIDGLPLHIYKEEDETKIKPCAEVLLTQRAAEDIMDNGIMPLLSFKDQDKVRLARFQSISDPPTSLAGRWNDS